jgi:hypothetical protein
MSAELALHQPDPLKSPFRVRLLVARTMPGRGQCEVFGKWTLWSVPRRRTAPINAYIVFGLATTKLANISREKFE